MAGGHAVAANGDTVRSRVSNHAPSGRLLIPVETKVRELDAKTLLACVAAESGFEAIIGHAGEMRRRLSALPQGTFLDKSVAPSREDMFRHYCDLGFRIVAWCEEGLTNPSDAEYLRRKVNPGALAKVDRFYAWGQRQAELIGARYPELANKLVTVGNPRIDMLRPELREFYAEAADALISRHGRYVLINTNFSLCNHKKGKDAFLKGLRAADKVGTAEEEAYIRGWIAYKTRLFEAFKQMVCNVARAIPKTRIIVRPHPSEDHSVWERLTCDIVNVTVCSEGNVATWLIGAEAIIHNGCTTGIEGYLMGRPVLAYMPCVDPPYEPPLANALGIGVATESELIARLDAILHHAGGSPVGDGVDSSIRSALAHTLSGLEGPLACERIVRDLKAHPPGSVSSPVRFRIALIRLVTRLRLALQYPQKEGGSAYNRQKFPGLAQSEIEDIVARIQTVTGRFSNLEITHLGDTCYRIISRSDRSLLYE